MDWNDPEQVREYHRNYRQDNKESLAVYHAEYRQDNKEAIAVRVAKYQQDNKEAIAVQQAQYQQDNKEALAVYQAKYRQDNKEAIALQRVEYRQDNKEEIAVRNAKYRQENKEEIAVRNAEYYQDNKEAVAAKNAEYKRENKEAVAVRNAEYRAKQKALAMQDYIDNFHTLDLSGGSPRVFVFPSIENSYKNLAFKEANCSIALNFYPNCWFCGVAFSASDKERKPTIDHGIPQSRASEFGLTMDEVHSPDNLCVCCQRCNSQKSADTWEEFAPEIWDEMKGFQPIVLGELAQSFS